MIDSIQLRVHFPRENGQIVHNQEIYNKLISLSINNRSKGIDHEHDWALYENSIYSDSMALVTDELLLKTFDLLKQETHGNEYTALAGRFRLRSSHYHVGYKLMIEKEYADLGFSIPKFIYGHSVAQFLTNPHTGRPRLMSREEQKKNIWNQFVRVLKIFFDRFFGTRTDGTSLVNFDFVQITEIDLCFNQYFESKEFAHEFLNEVQKTQTVSMRKSKRNVKSYTDSEHKTGIAVIKSHTYYKQYHKGTSVMKDDIPRILKGNKAKKEHLEALKEYYTDPEHGEIEFIQLKKSIENKRRELSLILGAGWYKTDKKHPFYKEDFELNEKDYKYYKNMHSAYYRELDEMQKKLMSKEEYRNTFNRIIDTQNLVDIADKIIRHELRIYGKTMSKDYNYFVRVMDEQNTITKNGGQASKLPRSITNRRKMLKKLEAKERRFNNKNDKKNILTPSEKENLKLLRSEFRKRYQWFLGENPDPSSKQFTKKILDFYLNKFFQYVDEYQVKELPKWSIMKARINEENKRREKIQALRYGENLANGIDKKPPLNKISITKFRKVYDYFKKGLDIDYMIEEGYISKRTGQRYKKDLRDIGLNNGMSSIPFVTSTDYDTYINDIEAFKLGKSNYKTYFCFTRKTDKALF